jgi:hypothetical protein
MVSGKQRHVGFYIPEFAKKNRVTIDLLGHGETECLSYVQTMEDNADAVHVYQNCASGSGARKTQWSSSTTSLVTV